MDVESAAAFVRSVGAKSVALQFPDELLTGSPAILSSLAAELRKESSSLSSKDGTVRLAILGDTSFGACCVDEVAAAHMPADAIIHYGPSCLSPPSNVPVLHVFERAAISVQAAAAAIVAAMSESSPADGDNNCLPVLLSFDTAYAHAIPDVLREVGRLLRIDTSTYQPIEEVAAPAAAVDDGDDSISARDVLTTRFTVRLVSPDPSRLAVPSYCTVAFPSATTASTAAKRTCCESSASSSNDSGSCCGSDSKASSAGQACCGAKVSQVAPVAGSSSSVAISSSDTNTQRETDSSSASYVNVLGMRVSLLPHNGSVGCGFSSVLYIGHRSSRLRAFTAQFAGAGIPVRQWDPRGDNGDPSCTLLSSSAGRLMSRRYRVIESLRGAGVIGIIAGTLAVSRHGELIAAVRAAAAAAGKACYTFLVGKLSPTKLGNFPEVDAYVLVACPEASLLDEAEEAGYVAPLATPQEALIALTSDGMGGDEDYDDDDEDDANNSDAPSSSSSLVWNGRCEFHFPTLLADVQAVIERRKRRRRGADDSTYDNGGAFLSLVAGRGASGHSSSGRMLAARPWVMAKAAPPPPSSEGSSSSTSSSSAPSSTALLAPSSSTSTALALASAAAGPNAGAGAAYLATHRQWRGLAYDYSDAVEAPTSAASTGGGGAAAKTSSSADDNGDDGNELFDGTDPQALALALYSGNSSSRLPGTAVVEGSSGRAAVYSNER